MDWMVKLGRDRLRNMGPAEISELMAETLPTLSPAQWQAVLDRVLAETRRRAPSPTPVRTKSLFSGSLG